MDLSQRDAATALNVSESVLARMVSDEGLPAFVINGRYRFNRTDLLEWATRHGLPTAALFQPGLESGPLHVLLAGHIHHEVPGTDMKSVMTSVAERMPLPAGNDMALMARVLADRELSGSTSVGDGIAIPHVRSPLILPLERAVMTLCFLATPVPVQAADDLPIRVVWALASPTVRVHLDLLARIGSALQDQRLRELLVTRGTAAAIVNRLAELA